MKLSMRALSVTEHQPLDREEAIDMLALAILMIKRGSTDAAISQLYFLIDNLEVATAIDEMLIAREIGCTPEFLCQ